MLTNIIWVGIDVDENVEVLWMDFAVNFSKKIWTIRRKLIMNTHMCALAPYLKSGALAPSYTLMANRAGI